MAIRSARMAAMRDLAEQIHGLKVDSSTTVIDLMVQNDTFRGVVSGTIRGARTVRINPTGSDTYEIVFEIDREMISHLMSTAHPSWLEGNIMAKAALNHRKIYSLAVLASRALCALWQ